jgi:hypothetical protein
MSAYNVRVMGERLKSYTIKVRSTPIPASGTQSHAGTSFPRGDFCEPDISHANPCLTPTPQDFNNPYAQANLRLTRRSSRTRITYLKMSVAHELAIAMRCPEAQRGEGSIHTATRGLGVSVTLRSHCSIVPLQRLFEIRAPKSESQSRCETLCDFFNEDHQPDPVMVSINVATSKRRSRRVRLHRVAASIVTFLISVNGFLQLTIAPYDGNFSLRCGPDETTYFEG